MSDPEMLVEPTNDMDTDMLAVIEDLLDSWPGTLLVVSHDRYFLERVTDQQYAILDARLRHLPGGVDEYLRLRQRQEAEARRDPRGPAAVAAASPASPASPASSTDAAQAAASTPALTGAELRAAQKEVQSIERRLAKVTEQVNSQRAALAEHDQADYVGLAAKMEHIAALEAESEELEGRWFELSEQLG